jgi:hypothetical protein
MKQCACTVGYNKWECRCVDENQIPVGPGSAKPTKIVKDGTKKDECACLCTENGGGGARRLLFETASDSTRSRRHLLSESSFEEPTEAREVRSPRKAQKRSYRHTRRMTMMLLPRSLSVSQICQDLG